MASVLDFARYSSELQRQLLRRIGYTNGLHKIKRFARVVEYLYAIMPSSVALLAQVIIREENKLANNNETPLSGIKYARGIVDVVGGLHLIDKFGPKISLSSEGYACHALTVEGGPLSEQLVDVFLLERLIHADGEYALNILRIVGGGVTDVIKIGRLLTESFLSILDYKERWAATYSFNKYTQTTLGGLLRDARRKFEKAVSVVPGKGNAVEYFYKHTINPRVEWLRDLGLLQQKGSEMVASGAGRALLAEVRHCGFFVGDTIILPLDHWLATELQLSNLFDSNDFTWRLVAASRGAPGPDLTVLQDHRLLLERVRRMYDAVKLINFNEADASSIYHVMAAHEAIQGRVLPERAFNQTLVELVKEFPSEVFRLSKRRGRGMYIALKR